MLSWRNWMAQSRRQFEAADLAKQGGVHFMACFSYHQAVEMALKAGLERRGIDHFGHALPPLYRTLCRAREVEVSDELEAAARRLNELYITTRYPDREQGGVPAERFGMEESDRARSDARSILDFVSEESDAD